MREWDLGGAFVSDLEQKDNIEVQVRLSVQFQ